MSNRKKEDPRAIRSKKAFKEAAVSLLLEEPSIAQLTVQKISDRAELNRATFYLHYQDMNDLLRQITNEFIDGLSTKLQHLEHADMINDREHLLLFLDYIYDNRKLLTILFDHKGFETKFFNLIKSLIETRRTQRRNELPSHLVSIEIRTSSIMGILMWWINDGIRFSSEYIADQISLMFKQNE